MSFRKPWTQKEDQILSSLVKKFGTTNWILISQKIQIRANTNPRTGKQCRQRWHNHLDPQVSKKSWTLQEEKIMFEAHQKYGNKWAQIAGEFQNRTDSDVKNHFYAVIRKCLRRISKMFGQKNSTEKIKNLKPSILSALLQSTNEKNSKQTSQALFKFILSRQNLNIDSLEMKTKKIFQLLIDRITTDQNEQKTEKLNQTKSHQNRKRLSKKQIETQKQSPLKLHLEVNKQKKQTKTKIDKKNLLSNFQLNDKKNEKDNKEVNELKLQGEPIQVCFDKKSSKILSVLENFSPSAGFQWIEENNEKQSSNQGKILNKQSLKQKSLLSDFMMLETPSGVRRRSSYKNDMCRILSNNDMRTIYVTPKNPTPGSGQNLFASWNLPHKLTNEQIDHQRQQIRREIQSNSKNVQNNNKKS